jgi:hypothetical protein
LGLTGARPRTGDRYNDDGAQDTPTQRVARGNKGRHSGKREATNFYVWDSEDAAKAFFTDEFLERVTGLYGVRPTVEFVQIAALVENART